MSYNYLYTVVVSLLKLSVYCSSQLTATVCILQQSVYVKAIQRVAVEAESCPALLANCIATPQHRYAAMMVSWRLDSFILFQKFIQKLYISDYFHIMNNCLTNCKKSELN